MDDLKTHTIDIKQWTSSNESLPKQDRWKLSFLDDTTYFEVESNSLWDVVRVAFVAWKQNLKRKRKAKRAQKDDHVHGFQ